MATVPSSTKKRQGPVEEAIWFIEACCSQDVSLDDVADSCGVSRFALSRAFAESTGRPVMNYLRGRRLTEAAKRLVAGDADDILRVALDSGYGSHEAFTRAFRDQFGVTPETVRARQHLDGLALVHPIKKETLMTPITLEAPAIMRHDTLQLAGLMQRYTGQTRHEIPLLWRHFGPHMGHVPGQVGATSYGVIINAEDDAAFDYMAAVEVSSASLVPAELTTLRIAAHNYAVFHHREHISKFFSTCHAVWSQWAPTAPVERGPWLEIYRETFNGMTGMGGVEIWIPIAA